MYADRHPISRPAQSSVTAPCAGGGAPPSGRAPGRARRSPADRLREALLALGDYRGQVVTHSECAWASITFSGARHMVAMLFAGDEAVAAAEHFIAELAEHEFAIPGQLVADAAITQVEHRLLPSARLVVQCELLLLEDD